MSIAWSGRVAVPGRPEVPVSTNPSVARLAQEAPWLCAPSSRTVCLYRETEPLVALLIGRSRETFNPLRYWAGRGVAQLGSARALGARGPGFKSRRPDIRPTR